jgi:hypothetical protein
MISQKEFELTRDICRVCDVHLQKEDSAIDIEFYSQYQIDNKEGFTNHGYLLFHKRCWQQIVPVEFFEKNVDLRTNNCYKCGDNFVVESDFIEVRFLDTDSAAINKVIWFHRKCWLHIAGPRYYIEKRTVF